MATRTAGIYRGGFGKAILAVWLLAASLPLWAQTCDQCHQPLAGIQAKSPMATTWRAVSVAPFVLDYIRTKLEGPPPEIRYTTQRDNEGLAFRVEMPGQPGVTLRAESAVGGNRHGVSFLLRLNELDGTRLARAPLIEARYLHDSHTGALSLSAGFPPEKPVSLETAIGRVLSPEFEKKCLSCHGSPSHTVTGKGGIRCEDCHGPVEPHLEALKNNLPSLQMPNPGKLPAGKLMDMCARCHAGFSEQADPLPDDLLISNQVTAIRNSECYIQTGGGFSCLNCHNPHEAAAGNSPAYRNTCLSCHGPAGSAPAPRPASRTAPRSPRQFFAAACPVNARGNCIECHMPAVKKGPFTIADHWIRVHPVKTPSPGSQVSSPGSQAVSRVVRGSAARSRVTPRRMFLRILVTRNQVEAQTALAGLRQGGSFFELARKHSVDPSAGAGGYLGAVNVDEMEPALAGAAVRLAPGDTSEIVASRGNFFILQRLPRDFRARATILEAKASELRLRGEFDQAIETYRQALEINPHFLRALVFLGVSFGEKGDHPRAIAALEQAAYLFPNDPSAQYNLGIAYGASERSDEEIRAYQRTITLDPDLVPAYLNLGAALLQAGRLDESARVFEDGIQINPLAAMLYVNLALVRQQQGKPDQARAVMEIALKIDPRLHGK